MRAGGSLALFSQLRRQGLLTEHDAERKSGGAGGSSSRRSLSEASIEGAKIPPNVRPLLDLDFVTY